LIRDREWKFPGLFDAVLAKRGSLWCVPAVRMPQMNAISERRVHSCRREFLDRTLIWDRHHLSRALREFEAFNNQPPAPPGHRERQAAASATTADH
jgi:putative transposase